MKKLDLGYWYDLRTLQSYNNPQEVIMALTREVAKALKSLEGQWKTTEPTVGFTQFTDGDYIGTPISMEIGLSKNNRLQVVTTFRIEDGQYAGEEYRKFDGINDEVGIGWFKGYGEILGIEMPDEMEDLQDALNAFIDSNPPAYHLTLKTKDGFQNCFLKGAAEEVDFGTPAEEAPEDPQGEELPEGPLDEGGEQLPEEDPTPPRRQAPRAQRQAPKPAPKQQPRQSKSAPTSRRPAARGRR